MYDRLTDYFPVDRQYPKFYFTIRLKKLVGHKDIGTFKSAMAALDFAKKHYTSSTKYQVVQVNEA